MLIKLNILTTLFLLMACSEGANIGTSENDKTLFGSDEKLSGVGYIKYVTVEGGYFELITSDNKIFDVHDLPDEYKKDGIVVKFTGHINKELVCVHAAAPILTLKIIERLEH